MGDFSMDCFREAPVPRTADHLLPHQSGHIKKAYNKAGANLAGRRAKQER